MLLVETATDLLRRIGVVVLPLALQPDLSAQLVRALRLRQAGIGRFQRGHIDNGTVTDPVFGIVDVATELVLTVIDLLVAVSRVALVRVMVHVPLPRRAAAPLPSTRLGPLLEMSSRALSAMVPIALAKLATFR